MGILSSERRWFAISPIALTANGTSDGVVTVSDTTGFKVKRRVKLESNTQGKTELEVKKVLSPTQMILGPISADMSDRADLSPFLTADSATIEAPETARPQIDNETTLRYTYDEEPTMARRSVLVDRYGQYYREDNPIPVQLSDGNIDIGTVNAELEVQLSSQDGEPDSGDVADSVRVGDQNFTANITPSDDELRNALNVVNLAKPFNRPWDEIEITAKNDCGDPTEIITRYKGEDVQRATITYDSDEDFESLTVTDL